MLYREIIAVCSQIHTKHVNTFCGQNVELLNVKLAVYIITTESYELTPLACYDTVYFVPKWFYSVQLCGDYCLYSEEVGQNQEEPKSGCPIPRLIFDPVPGEQKTLALPPTPPRPPRDCTLKVMLDTCLASCLLWHLPNFELHTTHTISWPGQRLLALATILLHRAS